MRMGGSDADLDTAHLMRLAGRFSRRVRAFADANGIPVIDCESGERKHELAEESLREYLAVRGVFLIGAAVNCVRQVGMPAGMTPINAMRAARASGPHG